MGNIIKLCSDCGKPFQCVEEKSYLTKLCEDCEDE